MNINIGQFLVSSLLTAVIGLGGVASKAMYNQVQRLTDTVDSNHKEVSEEVKKIHRELADVRMSVSAYTPQYWRDRIDELTRHVTEVRAQLHAHIHKTPHD